MWEIIKTVRKGAYLYAVVPDHPKAIDYGYVLMHRVVMENKLGRLLEDHEVVHHIDEDKFNNDPDNLQVMTQSEHTRMHQLAKGRRWITIRCPNCKDMFDIPYNRSFLGRKVGSYNTCSPRCRGQFSSSIQYNGITEEQQKAIDECVVKEFRVYKT